MADGPKTEAPVGSRRGQLLVTPGDADAPAADGASNSDLLVEVSRAIPRHVRSALYRYKVSGSKFFNSQAREFEEDYHKGISRIQESLYDRNYRSTAKLTKIRTQTGKERPILMFSISDFVLQSAILEVLASHIGHIVRTEQSFGISNEPGESSRSVRAMIGRVKRARGAGLSYLLKADIKDCFPSVPHEKVLGKTVAYLGNCSLNHLLLGCIYPSVNSERDIPNSVKSMMPRKDFGLPQGAVLSPFLLNCYLAEFDKLIADRFVLHRYVDDIAISVEDEARAKDAYMEISSKLESLGLSVGKLGEGKCQIYGPRENFSLLGIEFTKRNRIKPPRKAILRLYRKMIRYCRDLDQGKMSLGDLLVRMSGLIKSW